MSVKAQSPPDDALLVGGRLIDGTGRTAFSADLAIKGSRISAIGDLGGRRAKEEFDIRGKYLAPGFIDTHSHDDQACLGISSMTPKISQGVTSVVVGNCGMSLAPLFRPPEVPEPLNLLAETEAFRFGDFRSYFEAVEQAQPRTNVAALVGHSSLRVAAMRDLKRPANQNERRDMVDLLDEAMRSGASGLSTGVFYPPAKAADSGEIVPLLRKISEFGGVYATHLRDERDRIIESMQEAMDAARQGGVPLIISHHKCAGCRNWGRSQETLALIKEAQSTQDVSMDVYPYIAGSSVLSPELLDKDTRVLITWSTPHPSRSGMYLDDIAADWGCSEYEAACRLRPAGACYFFISEQDLNQIIGHPSAMIASDGLPRDSHPHPRLWGTFPRVIRRYAMEMGLFTIEEAIRKMTSLSAARFQIRDRGVLKPGNYADLVVFDPNTVGDLATFERPTQASAGIDHVFVNGQLSWNHGTPFDEGNGRMLRNRAQM